MNELDDSFSRLLGRQPSDAERQQLYRVRDALGLKNNDALWLVLMALQHYQNQYIQIPAAIAKSAENTLIDFRATANAILSAATGSAKADLAKAVAATAQEVAHNTSRKQMWQWASGCLVLVVLCLALLSWYVHSTAYKSGFNSGYGVGYSEAKDEKAAAAWANTPEGKVAYQLAQAGSIGNLARCDLPGWAAEDGSCFVRAAPNGNIYGWRLP